MRKFQNVPIDGSGTVASKGSLAIGSDAKVYGASYSLALGAGATIAADNLNGNTTNEAIAIGYNAKVNNNATHAIVIGSNATLIKPTPLLSATKHSLKKTVWLWEIMPRPAKTLLP